MGDGQHIWAAAEWALMIRNCFVREEEDGLVIGSGVPADWWQENGAEFGPTPDAMGQGDDPHRARDSVWSTDPGPRHSRRLAGGLRRARSAVARMLTVKWKERPAGSEKPVPSNSF